MKTASVWEVAPGPKAWRATFAGAVMHAAANTPQNVTKPCFRV